MNIVIEILLILVGIKLLGWEQYLLAILLIYLFTKTIGWFVLLFIKKSFETMISINIEKQRKKKTEGLHGNWKGD